MIVNNLYDKLPWRTKIYGIGIYGVSCSPSVVVSVDRSVVAVVVCFSVAEAVSVDRSVVVAAVVVCCSVAEQKKLVEVIRNENVRYAEQMLISMFTGMRMGEVIPRSCFIKRVVV